MLSRLVIALDEENKSTFSPSSSHEVMGPGARTLVFLVSSQLFYSPLSPSSTGSLVPLRFLPSEWYIYISEVVHISSSNLDSGL